MLIGRLCRGKAEAVKLDVEDADLLASPHANVMAFWILIVLFALGTAFMLFVLFNLFRESRKKGPEQDIDASECTNSPLPNQRSFPRRHGNSKPIASQTADQC